MRRPLALFACDLALFGLAALAGTLRFCGGVAKAGLDSAQVFHDYVRG